MKLLAVLISVLFVFPALSGCKKEPAGVQPKTEATAQKIQPAPQPTVQEPVGAKEETYVYEPKDRVDPFIPLIQAPKKEAKKLAATLESYDIADFKLIAIAEKGKQHYGLLLAPDDKSFTVTEGTILGLNKGQVIEIMKDKLTILEYIKDYKGGLKPRKITLELSKGEGE